MDTLNECYRGLMGHPSHLHETPRCSVCGRTYPINRHHIVWRSWGEMHDGRGRRMEKPVIELCGHGNADGCHGLAHARRLHFRWVEGKMQPVGTFKKGGYLTGHWEWLKTDEPTDYVDVMGIQDGWHRCS